MTEGSIGPVYVLMKTVHDAYGALDQLRDRALNGSVVPMTIFHSKKFPRLSRKTGEGNISAASKRGTSEDHHSKTAQHPQTAAYSSNATTTGQHRAASFKESHPSVSDVPDQMSKAQFKRIVKVMPQVLGANPFRSVRFSELLDNVPSQARAQSFRQTYKFVAMVPGELSRESFRASAAAVTSFMEQPSVKTGSSVEYEALMARAGGDHDAKTPSQKQTAMWNNAYLTARNKMPGLRRSQRLANSQGHEQMQQSGDQQAESHAAIDDPEIGNRTRAFQPAHTEVVVIPAQSYSNPPPHCRSQPNGGMATKSDPIVVD